MDDSQLILCLGSNFEQEKNIQQAQKMLRLELPNLCFTHNLWTEPIGVITPNYLNCLAYGTISITYWDILKLTKRIEKRLGRSQKAASSTKITIDIDILQYGNDKFHLSDWERNYVKELLVEISTQYQDTKV